MSSPSPAVVPSKYEVFISFRGEDTRNNFVSHLNSALVDREIITYLDSKNLEQGQTIKDELLKAIEESSIAVVVFSPNYCTSTWCLNELVKIMECRKSGLDVYPIFYDIDPSDVRKQNNTFFQAFSDHEKNFDAGTVKIWRNALEGASGLAGADVRGKDQSSLIKQLADKLSETKIGSQSRKSTMGIEFHFCISKSKKQVYSKPNEVIFVVSWRMSSTGKTTRAKAKIAKWKNKLVEEVEELHSKVLGTTLQVAFILLTTIPMII